MPPRKSATTGDKRKRERSARDQHDDAKQGLNAAGETGDAKDIDGDDDEAEQPKSKAAKTGKPALEWLLSDEAYEMANPEIPAGHGEVDWKDGPHKKTPPAESAGKKESEGPSAGDAILRYPHSNLTPFQNLIAACLLSKPFSHRLGLRTIQTLLNPPFSIRTLSDLDDAGYEGRRKIMWEARTQHKEKTAAQLGDLVDGVRALCGKGTEEEMSDLKGVKDMLKGSKSPVEAQKRVQDALTTIKGIGPGVVGIFLRRIQGDWEEVHPYADDRGLAAARKFGLIGESGGVTELAKQVKDRSELVRLLDTLIGLDLEKAVDKALERVG